WWLNMTTDESLIDTLIKELLDRFVSVIDEEVPDSVSPDTRDAWLTNIPQRGNIRRDRGRARSDIQLILNQLDELLLEDGHWALELFIKPIIQEQKGFEITGKMKALGERYVDLKKKQSELKERILKEQVEQRLHMQTPADNNKMRSLQKLLEPYNFDLK